MISSASSLARINLFLVSRPLRALRSDKDSPQSRDKVSLCHSDWKTAFQHHATDSIKKAVHILTSLLPFYPYKDPNNLKLKLWFSREVMRPNIFSQIYFTEVKAVFSNSTQSFLFLIWNGLMEFQESFSSRWVSLIRVDVVCKWEEVARVGRASLIGSWFHPGSPTSPYIWILCWGKGFRCLPLHNLTLLN